MWAKLIVSKMLAGLDWLVMLWYTYGVSRTALCVTYGSAEQFCEPGIFRESRSRKREKEEG